LTSIQPEDIANRHVLLAKAAYFYSTFSTLKSLISLQVTETRKDNLAAKRQEKRVQDPVVMPPLTSQFPHVWVGPPVPPQTEQEVRRIVSISDPSQSSAGSKLYHACQEVESQMLGNLFCEVTLSALYGDEAAVSWVHGRPQPPVLQWRSRYLSTIIHVNSSPLAAEIKLGPERIGARTDGGLQICLPQNTNLVAWDRSYYEIALEVRSPL